MITQFIKFLRVLGSEAEPIQISLAIALAMIMGFTPLFSLHNFIVVFVLLTFRINIAAFLLSWTLFSGLAYLLDPMFNSVGLSLLQQESLQSIWVTMYNSVYWRVANFNNTLLMGSLTVSLLAFVPVVLICNILIKQYRTHILAYLKNLRIVKFLQNSKTVTRLTSMMES